MKTKLQWMGMISALILYPHFQFGVFACLFINFQVHQIQTPFKITGMIPGPINFFRVKLRPDPV